MITQTDSEKDYVSFQLSLTTWWSSSKTMIYFTTTHTSHNIPSHSIPTQLAIFLVCVGHYDNVSSPKYVAQWAGVCIETVINTTYRCLIAFLALYDEVIMMPPEEEREQAKEYVTAITCPKWRGRFLLADGIKFALFQKPGLHGEV